MDNFALLGKNGMALSKNAWLFIDSMTHYWW